MPIPHPPCGLAAPAPRHYTFKFAAKMVSLIPEARASAQAPNIEAAWPKMSHIMFRGFRGLDSCFMTCHLTTVQVQGLAADVFCTSWETVWGLKILTYYGFHASIAYCKFFSDYFFHQHVTPERFLVDVSSLSLTTCHGVMNPIVGTKKLTYGMLLGMLGDQKGYPYLKVGKLSCPKRFHPLRPIGGRTCFGFSGWPTQVWPKWQHACGEGAHWA